MPLLHAVLLLLLPTLEPHQEYFNSIYAKEESTQGVKSSLLDDHHYFVEALVKAFKTLSSTATILLKKLKNNQL